MTNPLVAHYDLDVREVLLLGLALSFPDQVTAITLPKLTADKFIFSSGGVLGGNDHRRIWEAITYCVQEGVTPSVAAIMGYVKEGETLWSYLASLSGQVAGYYSLLSAEQPFIEALAEEIDKAGAIYRISAQRSELTTIISDTKLLQQYVNKVKDVDEWLNELIVQLSGAIKDTAQEYTPSQTSAARAKEQLCAIQEGRQSLLLSSGLPVVDAAGILPVGKLVILHGGSSMGKSAWARTVATGVAMGLLKEKVPGCVAIHSLEMTDIELMTQAAASLAHFDTTRLMMGPQALREESTQRFETMLDFVGLLPMYIDTTPLLTTSSLRYKLNSLHAGERGPVRLLVVDFNELVTDSEGENREQHLSNISRRLKALAMELQITVLLICSSTFKEGDGKKTRTAGKSGLRGSQGQLYAADVLLEMWNPFQLLAVGESYAVPEGCDEDHAWVLNQKKRLGAVGTSLAFNWDARYTQFSDPALDYGQDTPYPYTFCEGWELWPFHGNRVQLEIREF